MSYLDVGENELVVSKVISGVPEDNETESIDDHGRELPVVLSVAILVFSLLRLTAVSNSTVSQSLLLSAQTYICVAL